MQKSDLFIPEADFTSYTMVREYPNWKSQDLPQEIVAAPLYARLHVIQGSFLFRAYNDEEQIIYEEVFSPQNQQTLLKPNVRHIAIPQGEPFEAKLTLFSKNEL